MNRLIIIAAAVLSTVPVFAASIPAATYTGVSWGGGGTSVINLSGPGTADTGWGSTTLSSAPSLEILGTVSTTHKFYFGSGTIDVYFEVSGPDGTVPVDISGHVLDEWTGGNSMNGNSLDARLALFGGGNLIDQRCFQSNFGCSTAPGEFDGIMHEILSTNTVYMIELSARVSGSWSFGGATTGHALVDGVQISLGSIESNPGAYSLAVSDGITNWVASAPEPTTFLLAGAAFLALGLRRKIRG